eukprot:g6387.t1
MGCCCSSTFHISTTELNKLFTYDTPRKARVEDYRLGVMAIVGKILNAIYIFYVLVLAQGFFKKVTPTAVIQPILVNAGGKQWLHPPDLLKYCLPSEMKTGENVLTARHHCVTPGPDAATINMSQASCPQGYCVAPEKPGIYSLQNSASFQVTHSPNEKGIDTDPASKSYNYQIAMKLPENGPRRGYEIWKAHDISNGVSQYDLKTKEGCEAFSSVGAKWETEIHTERMSFYNRTYTFEDTGTNTVTTETLEASVRECRYFDYEELHQLDGEIQSVFVMTRLTQIVYVPDPNPNGVCDGMKNPSCQWKQIYGNDPAHSVFVAAPEFIRIKLEHSLEISQQSFLGQDLAYAVPEEAMEGFLVESNYENSNYDANYRYDICDFYTKQNYNCPKGETGSNIRFGVKGTADLIALGTLLQMAKVDLDDPSKVLPGTTKRYAGVVLLVTIDYRNTDHWFDTDEYRYTLSVREIENQEYGSEEELHLEPEFDQVTGAPQLAKKRLVYSRHGIRIIFNVTGSIGRYNFSEIMKAIVTGLAAWAGISMFMDFVAFSLMKGWKDGGKYQLIKKIHRVYTLDVEVWAMTNVPHLNDLQTSKRMSDGGGSGGTDPYIELVCNHQRHSTPVKVNDRSPIWTEKNAFTFKVEAPGMPSDHLFLYARDVDTGNLGGRDKLFAHGGFDLSELQADGYTRDIWIDLIPGGYFKQARKKKAKRKRRQGKKTKGDINFDSEEIEPCKVRLTITLTPRHEEKGGWFIRTEEMIRQNEKVKQMVASSAKRHLERFVAKTKNAKKKRAIEMTNMEDDSLITVNVSAPSEKEEEEEEEEEEGRYYSPKSKRFRKTKKFGFW